MYLSRSEIQEYNENGFVLSAERFTPSEVAVMKEQLAIMFSTDNPGKVFEKDGKTVRSVYGVHGTNPVFKRLYSHPRLFNPARQLVTSDLYVHQFKLNTKATFDGDVWQWHQDYIFWHNEDGMPEPRAVNAVVFLDDVNEFNGPICFVPGSHTEGLIEAETSGADLTYNQPHRAQPAWISDVSASLKYSLDKAVLARLAERHGIRAPKGPYGLLRQSGRHGANRLHYLPPLQPRVEKSHAPRLHMLLDITPKNANAFAVSVIPPIAYQYG